VYCHYPSRDFQIGNIVPVKAWVWCAARQDVEWQRKTWERMTYCCVYRGEEGGFRRCYGGAEYEEKEENWLVRPRSYIPKQCSQSAKFSNGPLVHSLHELGPAGAFLCLAVLEKGIY
jgi:hypothetical protein